MCLNPNFSGDTKNVYKKKKMAMIFKNKLKIFIIIKPLYLEKNCTKNLNKLGNIEAFVNVLPHRKFY